MLRVLQRPNRRRAMSPLDRSMPQWVVRCLQRITRQTWFLYVNGQRIGNGKAVDGIRERKRHCTMAETSTAGAISASGGLH
ncbi:hypothetical protein X747_32975 [Mesorhizobium sp. LNJC384A00]|nr:hypothetical protein X755_33000 [Mesorhizobium sp. LNJC405B00]ESY27383.1 hypothetical protein X747_32975 [Mesorhizobium sp. LNJC384A00]